MSKNIVASALLLSIIISAASFASDKRVAVNVASAPTQESFSGSRAPASVGRPTMQLPHISK